MNTTLSIGITNPLESFLLLLIVHKLSSNKKFNFVTNIKHFYILGFFNFVPQWFINNYEHDSFRQLIWSYAHGFVFMWLILVLYRIYFMRKNPNFLSCLLATTFNMITIMIYIKTISPYFGFLYNFSSVSFLQEFSINIILKIFQFLLVPLYIKLLRMCLNERKIN